MSDVTEAKAKIMSAGQSVGETAGYCQQIIDKLEESRGLFMSGVEGSDQPQADEVVAGYMMAQERTTELQQILLQLPQTMESIRL